MTLSIASILILKPAIAGDKAIFVQGLERRLLLLLAKQAAGHGGSEVSGGPKSSASGVQSIRQLNAQQSPGPSVTTHSRIPCLRRGEESPHHCTLETDGIPTDPREFAP